VNAKLFEIRDTGTFIPILAVKLAPHDEAERYLLARSGYGLKPEDQSKYVMIIRIVGGEGQATCDPFDWPRLMGNTRTMHYAHLHINEHFDALETGAVIDVEYILDERESPKKTEREEFGAAK